MKYGITLRTVETLPSGEETHHNVVMQRGLDFNQVHRKFWEHVNAMSALMGRNASTTHTRGGKGVSAEWAVQSGQPGDDLILFVDEYEDEE